MVQTRQNKRLASQISNGDHSSNLIKPLISAIESTKGPKLEVLKGLHYLLVHLSLSKPICHTINDETAPLIIKFYANGVALAFEDILSLSDILFKELEFRFNQFFSLSAAETHETSFPNAYGQVSNEEMIKLLRCCIVILNLIIPCPNYMLEKVLVLLSIIRRFLSADLRGICKNNYVLLTDPVSLQCKQNHISSASSSAEDFVSSLRLFESTVSLIFEVFMDELLINKLVRKHIFLLGSLSSSSDMLFMHQSCCENVGCVLEVVSAYFIFALSDEKTSNDFFNRLYWRPRNDFRVPEISLNGALSLLLNPAFSSAPKLFQAYLVLLVADSVGISKPPEAIGLNFQLMNCYLAAFQRSVFLYTKHMCYKNEDGDAMAGTDSLSDMYNPEGKYQPDFESFLLPATQKKIDLLVTKTDDSWHLFMSNIPHEEKTNMAAFSVAYAKEILCEFDKSCSNEVLSILTAIILRVSSDDVIDTISNRDKETSPQDLYLLASLLKLMSCSMMKVIWYLKNIKNSASMSKEYHAMMQVTGCFNKFSVSHPVQNFLHDKMGYHPKRHTKSKWILLHISGLLSQSYAGRLGFLAKDCIFMMVTLLNLFIVEEGDLSALSSLVDSRLEPSSLISTGKSGHVSVGRKSSQALALKFQKNRALYVGTGSQLPEDISTADRMDTSSAIRKDKCDGRSYLECVRENESVKSWEIDDLADFIECRAGKDYSSWLKDRLVFRQWKSQKATSRKKRRKKKFGDRKISKKL